MCEGEDLPLDGNGQLPGSRDGLYNDIRVLDTAFGQLCLGALEKRRDDSLVPACVHDADAQGAAVVLLWLGTFERGGSHINFFRSFFLFPSVFLLAHVYT